VVKRVNKTRSWSQLSEQVTEHDGAVIRKCDDVFDISVFSKCVIRDFVYITGLHIYLLQINI
jgi:hypothetical protein